MTDLESRVLAIENGFVKLKLERDTNKLEELTRNLNKWTNRRPLRHRLVDLLKKYPLEQINEIVKELTDDAIQINVEN